MTKTEPSQEKQIHIMEISLIPVFIAFFVTVFYPFYLRTVGVELSDQYLISSLFSIAIGSLIVCLALNEALRKIYGGQQFKFKRLVFRWILLTSYLSLVYVAYLGLSLLFPQTTLFWQFLWAALPITVIFVLMALRARHLFSRLDTNEW
jgi:hypothetical protein